MDSAETQLFEFELNRVRIMTTVENSPKLSADYLSSFFALPNDHRTKVIGFDTEWYYVSHEAIEEGAYFSPRCRVVSLCDGSKCLVIQLHTSSDPPLGTCKSLQNFLSLPNYTFVGVGIKDKLAKLDKLYGIGCRTSVELGPLAATLLNKPRLSFCGVDELSYVVNSFHLREHRPSSMSFDSGYGSLREEHAKFVTVNVYSYYEIGRTLLGGHID